MVSCLTLYGDLLLPVVVYILKGGGVVVHYYLVTLLISRVHLGKPVRTFEADKHSEVDRQKGYYSGTHTGS